MKAIIEVGKRKYAADLSKPLDISIPLQSGLNNPNAFGIDPPAFEPFKAGGFVGSVSHGGSVNCENLLINAHGNGTHTECVGHISEDRITINQSLKDFFSIAQVISVIPDYNQITLNTVRPLMNREAGALVIRTIANGEDKLVKKYSGNDPVFVEAALCTWLRENDLRHLLIDLPSVDPEEDGGALAAHRAFWNYPESPRLDATITEMVYVKDEIKDGLYLLNLQIAPLETDASPCKPVLYELTEVN